MTEEEFNVLGEKVQNNTCTPEEKLLFLKELNQSLTGLSQDLNKLNSKKALDSVRKDLID